MKQKLAETLFRPFYAKLFLIFALFLSELSVAVAFSSVVLKAALVYCACVCLYDLIFIRKIMKNGISLLFPIVFLLFYGVTLLLNKDNPEFLHNIYNAVFMTACLLIMYPDHGSCEDTDKLKKELSISCVLLIALSFAETLYASYAFLFDKSLTVTIDTAYGQTVFNAGFFENRLNGLYKTATLPGTAIGIFACILMFTLTKSKKIRAILCVIASLSFCRLSLANSRTIIYAAAGASIVLTTLLIIKKYADKKIIIRILSGILCGILVCAAVLTAVKLVRYAASYAQPAFAAFIGKGDPGNIPIDLERTDGAVSSDALTGRPFIWKTGLEYFKQKPLFGWGANSLYGTVKSSDGRETISHFHNMIVQSLVSSGAVGALILAAFFIFRIVSFAKYVFTRINDDLYVQVCVILAFIAFSVACSLVDSNTLFVTVLFAGVYWYYTGIMTGIYRRGALL